MTRKKKSHSETLNFLGEESSSFLCDFLTLKTIFDANVDKQRVIG